MRCARNMRRPKRHTGKALAFALGIVVGAAAMAAALLAGPLGSVANALPTQGAASNVPERLQLPGLAAGCEATSLSAALAGHGIEVDPSELADVDFSNDPDWTSADSYFGDVRVAGGAFPPAVVAAAQRYLARIGACGLVVSDASGASWSDVARQANSGNPVLVWTTMYGTEPAFSGFEIDGYPWYHNEHCVVVCAAADNSVLVMDPLEGYVVRDATRFAALYQSCGSYAVTIEKAR